MSNWVLAVTNDFSNMAAIKSEGYKYNFQVQYVCSINEAFEILAVKDFVLVAIRADGIEYMSKLRIMRELKPMPIIIFSYTYVSNTEKVEALRAGADVFIATPFAMEYMAESGLALIRLYEKLGCQNTLEPGSILVHEHMILSTQTRSVFVRGKEILLSKREFNILHLLMKEPGRVYSYEQLYKLIADLEDADNISKAIYNHIYQLRRKLKVSSELPDCIVSIKDVGYKLGYNSYNCELS